MYYFKFFLVLISLIGVSRAEVVPFKSCSDDCDIAQVRVDPCARDNANAACSLRRGKPATMELDFTPKFEADTLEASLNWVMANGNELPLITMDREACKYTQCPITNGEQQNYKVEIPMDRKFPMGAYTIKWTLKSGGKQCCFTHDIKLVR